MSGVGHPVPIHHVASVPALAKRLLVQSQEVAVPWQEGSHVMNYDRAAVSACSLRVTLEWPDSAERNSLTVLKDRRVHPDKVIVESVWFA